MLSTFKIQIFIESNPKLSKPHLLLPQLIVSVVFPFEKHDGLPNNPDYLSLPLEANLS